MDGVILGGDTRSTTEHNVSDRNCLKMHYLAPNIFCVGAGVAADTDVTTKIIRAELELHRLATDRCVPVVAAATLMKRFLYRRGGCIGASVILGGVDWRGASVYTIAPHGSIQKMPYASMGSGSLAAIAVLEKGWRPNLTLEEGKSLASDAIAAGIYNDLGTGSNIDLCIIARDGVEVLRPFKEIIEKGKMHGNYSYKHGATPVMKTEIIPLEVVETTVTGISPR